ncbi:MAG: hypothetical protein DDT33_00785 [Firmicutes bacterium]|nr:hypothetical protein [Bacillota bacterium]
MDKRKPSVDSAVYTVPEVSALLGVAVPTAYVMARSKEFPAFYIGKRCVIPKTTFDQWLNEQAIGRRVSSAGKSV